MNIPTVDLAQTGANIVNLRKAAGLSVHDLQRPTTENERRLGRKIFLTCALLFRVKNKLCYRLQFMGGIQHE